MQAVTQPWGVEEGRGDNHQMGLARARRGRAVADAARLRLRGAVLMAVFGVE